jgi:opacity protein-like surface antigen
MKFKVALTVLAAAAFSAQAQAAEFGIYGTAGTVGLGGGIAVTFNDYLGARLGYTAYDYTVDDIEETDLTLDGKLELGGVQALLDWYPVGGGFRVTVGAVESLSLSARARPIGGTYTLNGVDYDAADIGEATGTAKFDSLAPYLGVGLGRTLSADGRFAVSADIGVVFTGSPDVRLNVTCAVADAAFCADLQNDVAAERAELQSDADDLKFWPVLAVGVSYKF